MAKRKKVVAGWGSSAGRRKLRAKGVRSRNVMALRKEYCHARNRADHIGQALGMLTGTHKRSKHRKRHVVCRASR
jgi:hypothetical protein